MNTSTSAAIVFKTHGKRHGPITRLVSPGDVGQLIKPFVFLDYIEADGGGGPNFGFHPHSGIATLTFPITFDVEHETSDGQIDHVQAGGEEWMMAGSGIWHRGRAFSQVPMRGFQIWFCMPLSHELAKPEALFIQPSEVPTQGPVKVLLGNYQGLQSPIPSPNDVCYLWCSLQDGERWTYTLPTGHDRAWVFAQEGQLHVAGDILVRELAVFEAGLSTLSFQAQGACGFLLGSTAPYPHDLHLGYYSVHNSADALAQGEARIQVIGEQMRAEGKR
jgi:redox-sensitive bicupin YhaK (pirin superfamily)